MSSPVASTPTHDAIARLAHQLWTDRGCPARAETSTWLEAERRLTSPAPAPSAPPADAFAEFGLPSTAEDKLAGYQLPPATSVKEAIAEALQKKDARAAQTPHHTGPKSKPAETGKPIWSQPHSN